MALKSFFSDQIDRIRGFMNSPDRTLHVILHDPEMDQVLRKLLLKLDDDESNPAVMVATEAPFRSEEQFFGEALADLSESNEGFREELSKVGLELPRADASLPRMRERFAAYTSEVAASLPDWVGAYVVVVKPSEVEEPQGFRSAMSFLADHTPYEWAKYLVLEERQGASLEGIDRDCERAGFQLFHLSPEGIQEQIQEDLAKGGGLSPLEVRQYTAMLGGFAFAERDYESAEKHQQEVLRLAEADGKAEEKANALYNLGNTALAAENLEIAEDRFVAAAEVCLEAKANPLLAMVLTNLGVTLHRRGRIDESLEMFGAAHRTFKALNNPPGEAFALDSRAATLALEGRNDDAEEAWLEALATYARIGSQVMADVREHGRRDILDKLGRFYEATGQRAKLAEIRAQQGA